MLFLNCAFYDYSLSADLRSKIQKSLKRDSLQHNRAVTDMCMIYKIRKKLVNITNTSIHAPFIRYHHDDNHTQSHHHNVSKHQLYVRVVDFGTSFPTNCQLNHMFSHFMLQPSSGSQPYSALMQKFFCYCFKAQIFFLTLAGVTTCRAVVGR